MITLSIDGRSVTVPPGTTLWQAARQVGTDIPVLCHSPRLEPVGVCRLCVVDVGGRTLAASCVRACEEGMQVQTRSDRVEQQRRTLLALDPACAVRVVPGVSSVQAAAAACGMELAESGENLAVLSGVDDPARLRAALAACDGAVILKAYRSLPALRALLEDMGLGSGAVLVSRCGLDGEDVWRGTDAWPEKPSYFSIILVKK